MNDPGFNTSYPLPSPPLRDYMTYAKLMNGIFLIVAVAIVVVIVKKKNGKID